MSDSEVLGWLSEKNVGMGLANLKAVIQIPSFKVVQPELFEMSMQELQAYETPIS